MVTTHLVCSFLIVDCTLHVCIGSVQHLSIHTTLTKNKALARTVAEWEEPAQLLTVRVSNTEQKVGVFGRSLGAQYAICSYMVYEPKMRAQD